MTKSQDLAKNPKEWRQSLCGGRPTRHFEHWQCSNRKQKKYFEIHIFSSNAFHVWHL